MGDACISNIAYYLNQDLFFSLKRTSHANYMYMYISIDRTSNFSSMKLDLLENHLLSISKREAQICDVTCTCPIATRSRT